MGAWNRLPCRVVTEPDVQLEDDKVVLTFAVEPAVPSGGDCQGNDQVPYEVELPEPLGDQKLIDGQCASKAEASGTSYCQPDGVRYQP